MATNSAAVKTWAITLTSAVLVLGSRTAGNSMLIAMIPIVLFCYIDSYYLALEHQFRRAYDTFLDRVDDHTISTAEFYRLTPPHITWAGMRRACASQAIWPFYAGLFVLSLGLWAVSAH